MITLHTLKQFNVLLKEMTKYKQAHMKLNKNDIAIGINPKNIQNNDFMNYVQSAPTVGF